MVSKAAPNHSPRFYVDERCLVTGVRALAHLAVDYLVERVVTLDDDGRVTLVLGFLDKVPSA